MFETLENDSFAIGKPETESPFGANPHLVPVGRGEPEAIERSISELMGDAPLREAMDTIAMLQQTIEQKDQALIQSTIAASTAHQQLEKAKTQYEHLRKKLTTVVKAHETLTQKVAEAEQADLSQEKMIPESAVVQMKEQWRVAQKSMEREHTRLRGELAKAKAGWHQAGQELETQTRARRAEAAHASLKVANLEREVEAVRDSGASAVAAAKGGNMWVRLSGTAAATAVVMLALGVWWQYGRDASGRPAAAEATSASAAVTAPVIPARSSTAQSSTATAGLSGLMGSRGAFQKALGRLNSSLYGPIGVSPEQILRAVRESNAKTNPNVCNFQWNNGQPALYFGGAQVSLGSSLDSCADAVEQYLRPSRGPANGAPVVSAKK